MRNSCGFFVLFFCAINGVFLLNAALVHSQECGKMNTPNTRIQIAGSASFGEFPWMIRLMEYKCNERTCAYDPIGGGALIAFNVVLTVAHNIVDSSIIDLRVRAGEYNREVDEEPQPTVDRNITRKIVHGSFDRTYGSYDIAILILEAPFPTTLSHIGTICLPAEQENFDNSHCYFSGWGKKSPLDSHYPTILKKVGLQFMNREQCERTFRDTRLGPSFQLPRSLVCAGGEQGKDACTGDGGAPLVCPLVGSSGRYQLAGLVSWGLDCNYPNVPGAYVNVAMMRPWIDTQIRLYQ